MGDDANNKIDLLVAMNQASIEESKKAYEEIRSHAKVTEIRFKHIEEDVRELRDLHEDDMEKNSSAHKDFYREISIVKEKIIDIAARHGLVDAATQTTHEMERSQSAMF